MKGILLMCFGSNTYGAYAYNMAHSIKYFYPAANIHLLCDIDSINDIDTTIFDSFEVIDFERDEKGRIDNCLAKIKLFERSPFEKTLYLDVDGVCINSLEGLIERLESESLYVQVIDSGKKDKKIQYSLWATNDTIWDKFNLNEYSVLPALQTSIMWFDRSKKAKEFFKKVEDNYTNNRLQPDEYWHMWGKSSQHPDELYYSATMAQMDILPDQNLNPIYFPNRSIQESELFKKYQILAMHGAVGLVQPFAHKVYDRILQKVMNSQNKNHLYKSHRLYKGKFVGLKK